MKKLLLPVMLLLAATGFGQSGVRYSGGYTTHSTDGRGRTVTTQTQVRHNGYRGGGRNYVPQGRRGRGSCAPARGYYNYNYSPRASCGWGRQPARRVITQVSPCGTFYWNVTQDPYWIPGAWTYTNGCRTWVEGYWGWNDVCRTRVWY